MTNREEVAKKLREAAEDIEEVSPYPAVALNKITNIIAINEITSYQDFFNRLADLIDPTCSVYITEQHEIESATRYTAECSSCGALFGYFTTLQQAQATHPVYCPHCGARVVRE
jgi:DNA-directed RNA polymerase subunit RPC12/RpoP